MSLWNPIDPINAANPFPMYKKLREAQPIYKAHTGEWVITRYEDVKTILKDGRFLAGNKKDWLERSITYFGQKGQDFRAIGDAINSFVLLLNPPDHTHIKKFMATAWDNRDVENLIHDIVEGLLDQLKGKQSFDVAKEFSGHISAMTIARVMGVPLSDYMTLKEAASQFKVVDPYNDYKDLVMMSKSSKVFVDYFRNLIKVKSANPTEDLISKLILLSRDFQPKLSIEQLISICIFFFVAGEETTIGFVSTSLYHLSKHKNEREQWLNSPEISSSAVDELLRFDGPIHLLGRLAGESLDFNGHEIKKGEVITICLASANRDKTQFDHPDDLILTRHPNRHIAFGAGIHFCLGDWLARKQALIAIPAFLKAFPHYQVKDESLKWSHNISVRSIESMMVYSQNPQSITP